MLLLYFYSQNVEVRAQEQILTEDEICLLKQAFYAFLMGDINGCVLSLIALTKNHKDFNMALSLLENGDIEKAIVILDEKFIHEFKLDNPYYLLKGIIYNALEKPELAVEFLTKAIASESSYIRDNAYHNMGIALQKLGRNSEGKEYVKLAGLGLEQVKTYENLYKNLIEILRTYPNRFKDIKIFFSLLKDERVDINKINAFAAKGNVIVRVWLPRPLEVGHVSLQTDKYYISFWPRYNKLLPGKTTNLLLDLAMGREAKHNNLWDDIRAEERLPDVRLPLNLNANLINEAYIEFVRAGYNWALLGSVFKKSQNCSGLVLYLLAKGGIFNKVDISALISGESTLLNLGVITPLATTASTWGPLVAPLANCIPFIGLPLSLLLSNAPALTTWGLGFGGLVIYDRTITPNNINRIASLAFFSERQKTENLQFNNDKVISVAEKNINRPK